MKSSMNKILDIKNLDVSFPSQYGTIHAVKDINISLMQRKLLILIKTCIDIKYAYVTSDHVYQKGKAPSNCKNKQ